MILIKVNKLNNMKHNISNDYMLVSLASCPSNKLYNLDVLTTYQNIYVNRDIKDLESNGLRR